MEHITSLIYLASIADELNGALFLVGVVSSILWAIINFGIAFYDDDIPDSVKSKLSTTKWLGVIGVMGAVLVPSKDTIYLMAGAEIGKEVVQSETAQKVKVVLDKKLDEILSDGVKK